MFGKLDNFEKVGLAIATIIIGSVAIYNFGYKIPSIRRERARLEEKFRSAEVLQGKIIGESFNEGYDGGICASDKPETYRMKVMLGDSSHIVFRYVGSNAEEMYNEHREGDIVTFKDGFKPGDKF